MISLFTHPDPPAGAIPRPTRHTVFFGLLPPRDVARRVRGLVGELSASGRISGAPRPEQVLHVSLRLVGKGLAAPPSQRSIEVLCERAGRVRQRPFTVALTFVQAWGRRGASGPVVAMGEDGVFGVEALHRGLAEGFEAPEHPDFNPHMTLLYGAGPARPLAIPPITWTVRDFLLIHSHVGFSRYDVLGRFPLSI